MIADFRRFIGPIGVVGLAAVFCTPGVSAHYEHHGDRGYAPGYHQGWYPPPPPVPAVSIYVPPIAIGLPFGLPRPPPPPYYRPRYYGPDYYGGGPRYHFRHGHGHGHGHHGHWD
jgi:hypothetical protein